MKLFAPFRLDTINECLWRSSEAGADERILLTPKGFQVLQYLVEHAGRLVTQRELLEAVWPGAFIEPQAVRKQIFDLRQILVRRDCDAEDRRGMPLEHAPFERLEVPDLHRAVPAAGDEAAAIRQKGQIVDHGAMTSKDRAIFARYVANPEHGCSAGDC